MTSEERKVVEGIIDKMDKLQYARKWSELDNLYETLDPLKLSDLQAISYCRLGFASRNKTPAWKGLVERCKEVFGERLFRGLF